MKPIDVSKYPELQHSIFQYSPGYSPIFWIVVCLAAVLLILAFVFAVKSLLTKNWREGFLSVVAAFILMAISQPLQTIITQQVGHDPLSGIESSLSRTPYHQVKVISAVQEGGTYRVRLEGEKDVLTITPSRVILDDSSKESYLRLQHFQGDPDRDIPPITIFDELHLNSTFVATDERGPLQEESNNEN